MDSEIDKQRQQKFIDEAMRREPEAFESPALVEDAEFLRPYGISIPGKEYLPEGLIKHLPQDFIVEEIQTDGTVTDVSFGSLQPFAGAQPVFFHFTLVKCGLSTLEAIDELAKSLDCQRTDIGYSGIKDKDAVTAQRLSIKNVSADRLLAFRSDNMFLKDLAPAANPIHKGVIKGNRFTLHIRTSPGLFEPVAADTFIKRLDVVKRGGFYNFYYLQRFGMPRLGNIDTGLAIMQGEYEKAVRNIVSCTSEFETPFMKRTREAIGAAFGDWKKCEAIVADMPLLFRDEIAIFHYMEKNPGNWVGALQRMLDKVSINVYSVPSLFFNECISSYLERGQEPPAELPLLLSSDKAEIDSYADMLKAMGLYPFTGRCLKPFSIIKFMKRAVPTKDIPEFHGAALGDEGIILSFSLGKGQYATSLLAHLFNLVSGKAPEYATELVVDSKQAMGGAGIADTLAYFSKALDARKRSREVGTGASE